MGFVANSCRVFRREVRRMVSRFSYCALLTLLPTAAFAIFGSLFLRSVTGLPVALLDEDRSPTSRQLAQMIDATSGVDIYCNIASAAEGERLIRCGKARAMVTLPEGFERDLLGGRQPVVALYNSGSNLTTNGIVERDVQSAVRTFGVGVQLQLLEARGLSSAEAMAVAMPIEVDEHTLFNPCLDYAAYLAPTFMSMTLLIFAVLATIYAVGSELKESSAREWLDVGGGSMVAALVGKLALPTVMVLLWAGVMFFVLFALLGVALNGSVWLLVLATVIFIVSYESVALLFVALFDNMRMALSLGGGYSVLSFSFSGVTFPSIAMFAPVRILGYIFPFTYYMKIYVDLVVRGAPVGYALRTMAPMMLFCLLPIALLPRLKRVCCDSRYWGKS